MVEYYTYIYILAPPTMVGPFSPKGGETMNKYELIFILDPDIEEEARVSYIDRIKDIISRNGEIRAIDEWGTRQLAYEIQEKNEGYYVKINFSAGNEVPKELTRIFRISENVLRYLIVNEDE